jgi:Putative prokaryotic signal transducing protein
MRIAYRAESLIDAHLVKDALEREEIPAFIAGEYLTGAVGQLPAIDYVAVMVPECSAEAADAIVRQLEAQLAEARAAVDSWDGDAQLATDTP